MYKMKKIGIIEDDLAFADTIRDIIHSDPAYTVEIVCHSLNEVNENLSILDMDLILLDIQLPDGSGMDILKNLNLDINSLIIFIIKKIFRINNAVIF